MKQFKKQIIDILSSHATQAHRVVSCGELPDSFMAIDSDRFSDIADELISKLDIKERCTADKFDFDKLARWILVLVIILRKK